MSCHLSEIQGLRWPGGEPWERMSGHREISWLSSLAQGASPHSHFTHLLSVSITSMLKPMNMRKNSFFPLLLNLHIEILWRKQGSLELGGILARKINFYDPQPPKTRSYAEKSTSRWIWLCQKDRIVTIQQLTLVLGRRARKGAIPLSLIGHIQLLISFASVPRQRWVPNRGKQTAAPLSMKRGQDESGAFT